MKGPLMNTQYMILDPAEGELGPVDFDTARRYQSEGLLTGKQLKKVGEDRWQEPSSFPEIVIRQTEEYFAPLPPQCSLIGGAPRSDWSEWTPFLAIAAGVVLMIPMFIIAVKAGIFAMLGAMVGLLIYLLPSYVAVTRRAENTIAIAAVNVLLGWTVLGWLAALIWACTSRPGHA